MSFFGIEFILFFILVVVLSYILPRSIRCLFLLLSGYFFYGISQPAYLLLLFAATIIDYFIAIKIGRQRGTGKQKLYLLTGLVLSVGLLLFFRYYNFFNDTIRSLFTGLNIPYPIPSLKILLPIGISYYLFKKISYIADVYRGHIEPERNFIHLALYVSFFPEIVAGPIDRAAALLPQFIKNISVDFTRISEGLQLILWGCFKKLVIADRLGLLVHAVYDQPLQHRGVVIALATLFFSFQIYCDFSGYSDIAIGIGRVLGFKLTDNFKQPYLAESISGFWKRWHISLSTWLRDYLFLPISYALMRKIDQSKVAVKRADKWAYVGSVLCTMLLCGLWHGANWTFVAWGLVHGFFLAFAFVTKRVRIRMVRISGLKKLPRLHKGIKIAVTFLLVSFSWLLFRANSMADTLTLIVRLCSTPVMQYRQAGGESLLLGISQVDFIAALIALVFLMMVEYILEKKNIPVYHLLRGRPAWQRWAIYYLIIFAILLFGIYEQKMFIYGQF